MASGFHQTVIMGNVGKEPNLRFTANGLAVCDFTVAVNESFVSNGERKQKASWYNVVVFGKGAENVGQYLEKGRQVLIKGKMSFDSYEKDGQKRYTAKLVADPFGVTFVGRGNAQHDDGEGEGEDEEGLPFE